MKIINFRYLDVSLSFLVVVGIAYYNVNQTVVPSTEDPIAWESFDEGVTLAQQSDKKILVDVYTNWCMCCKKMDAEVYTNPEVPSLVNKHFVAIKLNAESNKRITFKGNSFGEAEFARQLGANAYPMTFFFDQNANPITEF